MPITKNGKEYEYNIDGDLVPLGTVTLDNMYGDFENRYRSDTPDTIFVEECLKDEEWKQAVDHLFGILDPLAFSTALERNEAINSFFMLADCNPQATHFTEKGKKTLKDLHAKYPPGPERDRLVGGIWQHDQEIE